MEDALNFQVCIDCTYATQYGTYSVENIDEETRAIIEAGLSYWTHHVFNVKDEHPYFSMRQCDLCRRHLAGDRFEVEAWTR